MAKILDFIKNYPSLMGVLVGLVIVAGMAIHHYETVLRQQGASAQREVVAESSRRFTEHARSQDEIALSSYEAAKRAIDPFNVVQMVNDYSATIVPENKAIRHDPNRKGGSPDRIGRLYDGLCSTYDACPDRNSASTQSTAGNVSSTKSTK